MAHDPLLYTLHAKTVSWGGGKLAFAKFSNFRAELLSPDWKYSWFDDFLILLQPIGPIKLNAKMTVDTTAHWSYSNKVQ